MKVAIIGGGPAGLAAVKHCLEQNIECTAFEQTENIGGTWIYTDKIKEDENGVPVHTAMYQGLRTNLPTRLMEFENFPHIPKDNFYITQPEVLEYIKSYANHFNLLPHIKLCHQVINVDPRPNEKWSLLVRNVKTKKVEEHTYDGVIVCNGHYTSPYMPSIPGMEHFNGKSIHCKQYRKPNIYAGKKVLVIGGGPSGLDISTLLNGIAKKVVFSFSKLFYGTPAEGVITKPRVSQFKEGKVIFVDGTEEDIDEVIYCTGYYPSYPFLSKNCGITVDDGWVKPLYKHFINIEHPTMAIVNITLVVSTFTLYSIQIRFYLALLKGHFKVSKEEMYEDLNQAVKKREDKGLPKKMTHFIALEQLDYCENLADIANIRKIPRVYGKMFAKILCNLDKKYGVKIIDDENFELVQLEYTTI
ncbi:senecionine N-oxygenase-like [Sitophilus oryzae]|uniref:Flavin-containing monooxygenase n=1 Tax=Sitophilus oryzae TaxID=7048 RepID=A0A6J2YMV6_SITOR|nr:senecionine N-oxygenase-like [Sitophilus oryzae]